MIGLPLVAPEGKELKRADEYWEGALQFLDTVKPSNRLVAARPSSLDSCLCLPAQLLPDLRSTFGWSMPEQKPASRFPVPLRHSLFPT
jgi:hypothetical protein